MSDKTKLETNLTSLISSYADILQPHDIGQFFYITRTPNLVRIAVLIHCNLIFDADFVLIAMDIHTLCFLLLSEIYNGIGHVADNNYNSCLQFYLYVVQFNLKYSNSLHSDTDMKDVLLVFTAFA
jgi:hypothetical protein